MPDSLRDIATRFADGSNPSTKLSEKGMYGLYDFYFRDLAGKPITLLELGVHSGESLKTFATYFKNGEIIGVDIDDRGTDFSAFSNIMFVVGDQRDEAQLAQICMAHAPNGLDVIIDDASHYGTWSLTSYNALFPHLKPGGLYIVEDWATDYWDDWADGSRFQRFTPAVTDGQIGKRIPSHDFGMVGFVKYLVDEVTSSGIRPSMNAPLTRPDRLELMHIHKEMVVLKKAS
jgi:SAM-dependent methyltransferase